MWSDIVGNSWYLKLHLLSKSPLISIIPGFILYWIIFYFFFHNVLNYELKLSEWIIAHPDIFVCLILILTTVLPRGFCLFYWVIFCRVSSYERCFPFRMITGSIVSHSKSSGLDSFTFTSSNSSPLFSAYDLSIGAIIWQRLQNSPLISLIILSSVTS